MQIEFRDRLSYLILFLLKNIWVLKIRYSKSGKEIEELNILSELPANKVADII